MKSKLSAALAVILCALTLSAAKASSITYSITYNVNIALVFGVTANGTITTDGMLGTLTASDITDWNLLLHGGLANFTLSNSNSSVADLGTTPPLTATSTGLFFDFSSTTLGFIGFATSGSTNGLSFCDVGACGSQFAGIAIIVNSLGITEKSSGDLEIASRATPIPAAFPLFATGLGAMGLLGWRRKRKARVVA
jgi:hypothetical protein